MSVFFTVSPSSPSPTPLSFLVPHPCRCSHPVSPVGSLILSIASRQLLAVLPFSMTAGTLPSYPRATDYLCLRAKREMKAKLFDTVDFPLWLSLFSFSFFRLSPSLTLLPSIALYLYRCVSLHLSVSFSPYPFISLSHPSVTLVSPISLSGLHARASFPSYRRAAAILLPPF